MEPLIGEDSSNSSKAFIQLWILTTRTLLASRLGEATRRVIRMGNCSILILIVNFVDLSHLGTSSRNRLSCFSVGLFWLCVNSGCQFLQVESAAPTVAENHTRLVSLHWPWVWGSQDFTADFRTETVEYDSAVLGQLTPADPADGPTKRSAAATFRVEAE